jgi:hypothetical protein
MLREKEGVAAQVLTNFGITLGAAREAILKTRSSPPREPT